MSYAPLSMNKILLNDVYFHACNRVETTLSSHNKLSHAFNKAVAPGMVGRRRDHFGIKLNLLIKYSFGFKSRQVPFSSFSQPNFAVNRKRSFKNRGEPVAKKKYDANKRTCFMARPVLIVLWGSCRHRAKKGNR